MSGSEDGGFLSRWARRKAEARRGPQAESPSIEATESPANQAPALASNAEAADGAVAVESASVAPGAPQPAAPLPTLADVAKLTRHSDYSSFVQPGVSAEVRNAALKQLFTDPHFNVMDGLDTYIDDYGKPDPIPLAMLRQLHQSRLLGLFDAEHEQEGAGASSDGGAAAAMAESMPSVRSGPASGPPPARPDDDPDLRLQQDDGVERAGPAPGARA